MQLFMYSVPDADEEELREQCRNTVLEYEESMQVWEEIGDTGELDSSSTDSEEGDKLTGEDLLQDLDKAPMAINPPPVASKAGSSYIDRSKRILRQTILVSSIAAEIESHQWNRLGRELLQGVPQAITAYGGADKGHLRRPENGTDSGPGGSGSAALDSLGTGDDGACFRARGRPDHPNRRAVHKARWKQGSERVQ